MPVRQRLYNLLGRRVIDRIPPEQVLARTPAAFHRARLKRGVSLHDAAAAMLACEQRLIADENHYFDLVVLEKRADKARVRDRRGQEFEVTDLVSNSYNDLEWVPEVRAQLVDFVATAPLASCISRKIAGLHGVHDALRTELAAHMGYQACILGTNGYISQLSTIFALFHEGDVIFSEQHNHSSLVDGCRLSHARVIPFRHRDYDHLESLLIEHRGRYNGAGIVSDGVFSTKGAVADVDAIVRLARQHGCVSVIDDTHGVGVLGARGRGVLDRFASRPDVLTGGFGKAFGSFGGFVLVDEPLRVVIDVLGRQNVNSSFLSPVVAAQSLFGFRYLRDHYDAVAGERDRKLRTFNEALRAQGLACYADPEAWIHPIFCLYHPSESDTLRVQRRLLDEGFLPSFFPPPVAPFPSLRFSLHRCVDEAELGRLAALLGGCGLFVDAGGARAATGRARRSLSDRARSAWRRVRRGGG